MAKADKQVITGKMVKIRVLNKAAFDHIPEGEEINVWGNLFTVGKMGELEAIVPEHIAIEGSAVGRYMIVDQTSTASI